MAIDLKLTEDSTNGLYDVSFLNGDFETVNSFDTSLTVSLFGDARATESQIPQAHLRRGWWGNEFDDDFPIYQLGSRLWLLHQARNTQDTLNSAIDFTKESLQWLVDKGHAKSVEVTGQRTTNNITLAITINRGNSVVETRYYDLWDNTGNI